MSYPGETIQVMAEFTLPRRFVIPSHEQFAGALNRATAYLWWREMHGDVTLERPLGMTAAGNHAAIAWAAGLKANPPGYDAPHARTRRNLLHLAEVFEMMTHGLKVDLLEQDPLVDAYIDQHFAEGVLFMFEYLLGMRDEYLGVAMAPEDISAARAFYQKTMQDARKREAAAA